MRTKRQVRKEVKRTSRGNNVFRGKHGKHG